MLHCKFRNEGDDNRQKEVLFISLLGHSTFSKLKVLASPMSVSDFPMEAIIELLVGHYRW